MLLQKQRPITLRHHSDGEQHNGVPGGQDKHRPQPDPAPCLFLYGKAQQNTGVEGGTIKDGGQSDVKGCVEQRLESDSHVHAEHAHDQKHYRPQYEV